MCANRISTKSALDKIKAARASRGFGIFADAFIAKNNRLYASDGKMAASIPCEEMAGLSRLIPGDELQNLVSRLDATVTVTSDENTITIRAGKMRGTIQTQSPDTVAMMEPADEWQTPPPTLINAMRTARPFVAEVAAQPYATCLCFRSEGIFATTNISLIQVECPGLAPPSDMLVPAWAAGFAIKTDGELTGIILNQSYIAFRWADGLWLRAQLIQGAFPAAAGALLGAVAPNQPLAITSAWRRAYCAVAAISEEVVAIEPDRIVGGHGRSQVVYETAASGLTETLRLDPKYSTPVVECATAWDPSAFPKPVPFVGPGIKGLIVGRRA